MSPRAGRPSPRVRRWSTLRAISRRCGSTWWSSATRRRARPSFWAIASPPALEPAYHDHASRADEPRRRNRLARRRWTAQRHPRSGHQRCRGPHGGALSARRRPRRAGRRRKTRRRRVTQPILLQGGHVIDPSREMDQAADVLIQDGKIASVGRGLSAPDDGRPVISSHLMRTALEYARTFNIPVADHCEDPTLAAGGVMHEGLVSTRLGLKGIPAAAEEIIVARDVLLAELTGGHVHLCHMSARGSVAIIRDAKERGIRV